MKNLELKVPPLILTSAMAIFMILLSGHLPSTEVYSWVRISSASVIFLTGLYFCIAGIVEFRKHNTTIDPRVPKNVSALVDSGIYRVSRNPMYVGFALLLMSIVIYLSSPLLVLGVVGFVGYMNRFQIMPEERFLRETFGERYKAYTQRVRRWI